MRVNDTIYRCNMDMKSWFHVVRRCSNKLWASDIKDRGYETGTFKLGQTIYPIHNKVHRFHFHRKCEYCDSTGSILLKGKKFNCPECCGFSDCKEVVEKVLDEPEKVKSIMSFKNRNKQLEIYTNDSSGNGLIIQKQDDGTNNYFASKEEAQEVCDKYNKENNVYLILDEYKRQEIRESIS